MKRLFIRTEGNNLRHKFSSNFQVLSERQEVSRRTFSWRWRLWGQVERGDGEKNLWWRSCKAARVCSWGWDLLTGSSGETGAVAGGLKMRGAELFSSSPLLSSPAKERKEGREMLLSSQAPQEEASVCWEGEGGPRSFPPTFSLFNKSLRSHLQSSATPPAFQIHQGAELFYDHSWKKRNQPWSDFLFTHSCNMLLSYAHARLYFITLHIVLILFFSFLCLNTFSKVDVNGLLNDQI